MKRIASITVIVIALLILLNLNWARAETGTLTVIVYDAERKCLSNAMVVLYNSSYQWLDEKLTDDFGRATF